MPSDEPSSAFDTAKRELRRAVRVRRATLTDAARTEKSRQAADRLIGVLGSEIAGPVAVFRSLPHEIDTAPLIARLRGTGLDILLPRQVAKGLPLAWHRWAPGDRLVSGSFGVEEPPADGVVGWPATVIVPLLAFDAAGRRLGYGAGFYDRSLAALGARTKPLAVGFAFDLQEVDQVPTEAHDVPLSFVVTETRVLRFLDGDERCP